MIFLVCLNMKTIKPITENLEYYEYNDELKLVHLIKEDMFQCKSILNSLKSNKQTNEWLRNENTKRLINGFKRIREFSDTDKLIKKIPKTIGSTTDGYYIHRLLVNHFAMWINVEYAYKISLILDEHFENLRLRKEVEEKKGCIHELKELIRTQNTKIDNLENKIDEQSKKIDNQTKILTEVKHSLTSIADSVIELNKHVTSNIICKYHILLWLDKDNQKKNKASDKVTIKTFVGLIENTPKLNKTDKILLQEEVSCSLDSFKHALSNLSDMAFTTNYRNIIVDQIDLELFITKFKTELIQINKPMKDIHKSITNLEFTVKEQNTRLDKIENKLNLICQFYNITEQKYNEIEKGKWSFKHKNRWRDIKINKSKNKLYVNFGKNNGEIYYLDKGDI